MKAWLTVAAAMMGLSALLGAQQEPGSEGAKAAPKNREEALRPLNEFVGDWDFQAKSMMPGQEARTMQGVEVARMAYGGNWLHCEDEGADSSGKTFAGMSVIGYDERKHEYTGVWVNSHSPFLRRMDGDVDSTRRVFVFKPTGKASELGLGYPSENDAQEQGRPDVGSASYQSRKGALDAEQAEVHRPDRMVIEFKDADHRTTRVYGKEGDKEVVWAEIQYARRPAAK